MIERIEMSMYSSTDIMTGLTDGSIIIPEFDETRLGPNSYDVTLGKYFYEVIWDDDGPWFIGPKVAKVGDRVHIPVGGTLLAMTADVVGTKGRVVAKMQSRSSTVRCGIDACKSAGLGDVGYINHWTMELTGFSTHGKPFLTVGEPVAQLVFFETKTEPIKPYEGQYNESDWPGCMIPKKWRHRVKLIT